MKKQGFSGTYWIYCEEVVFFWYLLDIYCEEVGFFWYLLDLLSRSRVFLVLTGFTVKK